MKNDFLKRLQGRIISAENESEMSDWVAQNTSFPSGDKFGYKGHEFQREIVNDMHPSMCVKKLSQVGLTEVSIRKSIGFLAKNPGTSVLYTFPNGDMKKRNVQARVKPIFDRDFPLVKNDSQVRNNDIMQLGQSFLYVSGNTEGDATSTPIDMIVNDEYDLSDQEFLALVNSRYQHSKHKIKQGFSTPTFSGYGIALEYESSDQREFWVQCEHCNHWQIPMYDLKNVYIPGLPSSVENLITDIDMTTAVSLDLDNAYCCCEKCRKRLNLGDGSKREWIAKHPDRLHSRGYWVRPFSSDLLSIRYLVTTMADYLKRDKLRRGVNTVLGMEYSDSNARLELSDIMACMIDEKTPEVGKLKPCYIGIDVGRYCHITINTNESDQVYFATVPAEELLEHLKTLDEKYNIVSGAIDRYPETTLSNAVRDWSEGRIMPVVYSVGKTVEPYKDLNGNIDYYKVNRTTALDKIKDLVNKRRLQMYGYGHFKSIICEHLRDMFRDETSSGDQPRWVKMNGNDHFFHSMGYSYAAREIFEAEQGLSKENREIVLCYGNTSKKSLYNNDLLSYSRKRKY